MIAIEIQRRLNNLKLEVNFNLKDGVICALLGNSGAGKSTIIRSIAGLEKRSRCNITYRNKIWESFTSKQKISCNQRELSIIFQEENLFPHLSVIKNLQLPGKYRNLAKHYSLEELIDIFELKNILHLKPEVISGGEKQKVALARMLLLDNSIILLDEAFSAIDRKSRINIIKFLREHFIAQGSIVLFASHLYSEVEALASEVMLLDSGKICFRGDLKSAETRREFPL